MKTDIGESLRTIATIERTRSSIFDAILTPLTEKKNYIYLARSLCLLSISVTTLSV